MALFTLTINASVNQPPSQVGNNTLSTPHNTAIIFTVANYTSGTIPPYTDPEGDAAENLRILTLPVTGTLMYNAIAVIVNQEIPFTSGIDSNLFSYVPDALTVTAYQDTFTFEISDVGSSTYTGTGTMTIDVESAINQPPSQVGDNSDTLNYGETKVFTTADFTSGTTPIYVDPEGDSADKLKILSLPTQGFLRLDGVDVVLNQIIDFSDINSGLFSWSPEIDNYSGYTVDFNFSIADAGSGEFTE